MTSSSTYKLLNVETFKELISADVNFDEYSTFRVVVGKTVKDVKRPQKKRLVEGVRKALTERPIERPAESQRPDVQQRLVDRTKKASTKRVRSTLGASDQRLPKLI